MAKNFAEMLTLDLIANYNPVYPEGGTWIETAELLYAEESDRMRELTESLRKKGWREPIWLSTPDELEEGASPKVFNGTHRVCIALREGVIALPVATWHDLPGGEERPIANLKVELVSGELPSPIGTSYEDDPDWAIFDLLRSFPLDEDNWLNSDLSTGGQDAWNFFYENVEESQLSKLKTAVRRRLRKSFPGVEFKVEAIMEELEAEDSDSIDKEN